MASKPQEIQRQDRRLPTEGVRCPLGTVVDLSPSGLRAQTDHKPSVLKGHVLNIHIQADNRKVEVRGQVVWIRRLGRLKKLWQIGVQFEDQSTPIRITLGSLARAFRAKTDTPDSAEKSEPPETTAEAEFDNLYTLLGVTPSAAYADIRASYHRLAFQWHPDRCAHPQAVETFNRISRAHAILRDPATRRRYDDMLAGGRVAA